MKVPGLDIGRRNIPLQHMKRAVAGEGGNKSISWAGTTTVWAIKLTPTARLLAESGMVTEEETCVFLLDYLERHSQGIGPGDRFLETRFFERQEWQVQETSVSGDNTHVRITCKSLKTSTIETPITASITVIWQGQGSATMPGAFMPVTETDFSLSASRVVLANASGRVPVQVTTTKTWTVSPSTVPWLVVNAAPNLMPPRIQFEANGTNSQPLDLQTTINIRFQP